MTSLEKEKGANQHQHDKVNLKMEEKKACRTLDEGRSALRR